MKRDSNGRFMSDKNYVWVMKSVNKDMSSAHNPEFKYPEQGMAQADDWKETAECGNGLHGFLWGEGDGSLADFTANSKWLLIQVNPQDGLVQMKDKCKFRRGEVMMVGDYHQIAEEMLKHVPGDRPHHVIGSVITHNDDRVIVGGDRSILEGGNYSTVTGGYKSAVKGGAYSTVTGGAYSTVTGGYKSAVKGGDYSTVTGGGRSTVMGGYKSTVTGGDHSAVTGGANSIIILEYWNGSTYKKKAGTIGEQGLEPNVWYKLDENHEFVRAE